MRSNHQLLAAVTGDNPVIITPCAVPPSIKSVEAWTKGRAEYKKLKAKEEEQKEIREPKEERFQEEGPSKEGKGKGKGKGKSSKKAGDTETDKEVVLKPSTSKDQTARPPIPASSQPAIHLSTPHGSVTVMQSASQGLKNSFSQSKVEELKSPPPLKKRKSVGFAQMTSTQVISSTPMLLKKASTLELELPEFYSSPVPSTSQGNLDDSGVSADIHEISDGDSPKDSSSVISSTPVASQRHQRKTSADLSPTCTPILGRRTSRRSRSNDSVDQSFSQKPRRLSLSRRLSTGTEGSLRRILLTSQMQVKT